MTTREEETKPDGEQTTEDRQNTSEPADVGSRNRHGTSVPSTENRHGTSEPSK